MTQCPKCIKGNLAVDNDAKRWLPYHGKDSVTFITASGTTGKFRCSFGDISKTYKNFDCDDYYTADSVGFSMEIFPPDSLFISCNISSPSWLCFNVRDKNSYYIGGCNVINGSASEMRRKFSNLRLNNVVYPEVVLVNGYPGTNPGFDSLYFAKNYGIISFKYNSVHYYLKQ